MEINSTRLPFRSLVYHGLTAVGVILGIIALSSCTSKENPLPTPSPKPKEVEMIRDQAYHTDEADEHLLDIYLPNQIAGPYPTLLMIHGGGGHKMDLAFWGQAFVEKGYATISIDHRQWPDHKYPAHLEDAFCALAWIHSSAETYQFDTDNIFVMGHSAGGTMAAMLGVADDPEQYTKECPYSLPDKNWVRGVIPVTGIYDYRNVIAQSASLEKYAIELLGGTPQEVPEIWTEASAASRVDGSDPPFLIIHGLEDQNIPPQQSQDFADALEAAGVEVDLLLVAGSDHNQIKNSTQTIEAVENFISNHLIK